MTGADEIERALADLVRTATFDVPGCGTLSAGAVKALYNNRRDLDTTWARADEEALRVDDAQISLFAGILTPLLTRFIEPTAGRIGNGLFSLTGGPGSRAYLSLGELAKLLIVGGTRLGARRACSLFLGWLAGEPLRTRWHVLINGIRVDGAVALDGVDIAMLSDSSVELPWFLTHSAVAGVVVPAHLAERMAVVSLDLEHEPALSRTGSERGLARLGETIERYARQPKSAVGFQRFVL